MTNHLSDFSPTGPRYFSPDDEMPPGFAYPKSYIDFVEGNKPSPVAMVGMPPWIFAGNLLWAKKESQSELGALLIPFAQAENMDMVAYFEVSDTDTQNVWVANPWEPLPQNRVYEKFSSFDEWLSFAQRISHEVLEDKPQLKQSKFWFPGG